MRLKRVSFLICLLIFTSSIPLAWAQDPTPEAEIEMTEVSLEDNHIQFTFSHPAAWVGEELESPFLAMHFAGDEETLALNLLMSSEPPVWQSGRFAVAIFLADQRQFPNTGDLSNDASIPDIAAFAATGFEGVFQDLEVCGFAIEDRPAAQIRGTFGEGETGFEYLTLLVDMGMGTDYREFGQLVGLAAIGEMDDLAAVLRDVATSMEVVEDGEPRPLDEVESTAELPECEFETE
jgi:hypothetical protein